MHAQLLSSGNSEKSHLSQMYTTSDMWYVWATDPQAQRVIWRSKVKIRWPTQPRLQKTVWLVSLGMMVRSLGFRILQIYVQIPPMWTTPGAGLSLPKLQFVYPKKKKKENNNNSYCRRLLSYLKGSDGNNIYYWSRHFMCQACFKPITCANSLHLCCNPMK